MHRAISNAVRPCQLKTRCQTDNGLPLVTFAAESSMLLPVQRDGQVS